MKQLYILLGCVPPAALRFPFVVGVGFCFPEGGGASALLGGGWGWGGKVCVVWGGPWSTFPGGGVCFRRGGFAFEWGGGWAYFGRGYTFAGGGGGLPRGGDCPVKV